MFDVIIVGAGPAGLNAALVLGRCRRRVLVCDSGHPRNAVSHALHGFLSRDGINPAELLRIGREQMEPYQSVEIRDGTVTAALLHRDQFTVTLDNNQQAASRKLLFATGVVDVLPAIKGIEAFYGRSVFHCPYCDGWEVRDQALAVYGRQDSGVGLIQTLRGWSHDLALCTDGPAPLSKKDQRCLSRLGVKVYSESIGSLEGANGQLERIVFYNGETLACRAMFFNTGQYQRSKLPAELGCKLTTDGSVKVDEEGQTSVPGVYIAGDASRDVQFAIVAAAEGAQAAFAINKALLEGSID